MCPVKAGTGRAGTLATVGALASGGTFATAGALSIGGTTAFSVAYGRAATSAMGRPCVSRAIGSVFDVGAVLAIGSKRGAGAVWAICGRLGGNGTEAVCGVCGASLGRPLTLLGTRSEVDRNAFHFPPSHLECATRLVEAYVGSSAPVLGQPEGVQEWHLVTTGGFEFVRPNKEDLDQRPRFEPNSVLGVQPVA